MIILSVKLVHDYGYVHRDIKPNNFVMGHKDDLERAHIVHILDFGLSRAYAVFKNGKWIARKARGTAEFRGTLRYCSPNVHEKKEQGRQDDLWSLFYVLIELHCGLPWQTVRDKHKVLCTYIHGKSLTNVQIIKVEVIKMNIPDENLVQNFPREFRISHTCFQKLEFSVYG
ncbi:hypothetical protein NECAME_16078 [Necator americanus]|uniref:non-specific serine/threonine protein kinase n=1 Tax=Necator americanus TaxID=51031 RepID=W2U0K1_NECAM|nr:hypothetical protein NECAME_16078 [Necator americanus]ETN86876.1 hypothetical protein NECAME_16078 [Necator americanus]